MKQKNKRRLIFITGTRADFGKIKSLLNYVENSSEFELFVIVTGMHMLSKYGSTYKEILKQNYKNIYLANNQFVDEPMSSILGNTVSLFSRFFIEIKPDMVFIHGDRIEALAGALAGALEGCLVSHIEGGEVSGTIDESIRHSISKFAHVHFVANNAAKNRLIKMGEFEKNIYVIGSPDIDIMCSSLLPTIDDVKKYYDILFNDFAIVLFHPVTTEFKNFAEYAHDFFTAIKKSGDNYVVIYPNNDLGSNFIMDEIDNLQSFKNIKIFPSIRFEFFLVLLKNARFIIGNSSAGIREAPFCGVGSVNVGTRQNGRFKSDSIIDCSYDLKDILLAINKVKKLKNLKKNTSFGIGNSTQKFIDVMSSKNIWNISKQKVFID
ncbi:UDP-N-acetylglucosamine 2-epimerase [Campylobacter concisus]